MSALILSASLVISLPLVGCSDSSEAVQKLTVSGSTTVLPIAEMAADGFSEVDSSVSVLVSGLGSSAGIEAVSNGTADIATSSRDLKDTEADLGLVDTVIAYDGIAIIVNEDNPVDNITLEQLRAIYAGEITNWSELGGNDSTINLVNRDEASGTREAFKKIVMGEDTLFDRSAAVLPGTGQVRDVVSRSEGAIGYISVGFVESDFTDTTVKVLSVDGVYASDETVASGEYPISRELHLFTLGEPTGVIKEYIDFVLSDEMATVIEDAGFVPASSVTTSSDEEDAE